MLADALAQYLRWKRWQRWFLVYGTEPGDEAFANALRRSAKRFGLKIVEERQFKDDVGSRADGGHEQIQERRARPWDSRSWATRLRGTHPPPNRHSNHKP